MIVRPAKLEDTQALTLILNEIIEIGGTTAYETPLEPEYFVAIVNDPDPKTFIHVVEAAGQVIAVQWMEAYAPPEDHIGGIATFAKPGLTQRGVGSLLFKTTLQASRDAGYVLLNATIRADNASGLAYYSKVGFQDFDVIPAVPLKDGTPMDRVRKRFTL